MSAWVLQQNITTPLTGIAYGGGKFVSIYAGSSSNCIVSSNGINWTQTSLSGTYGLAAITYGNDMFVAIGSSYIYSTDGNTWSSPLVILNLSMKSIIYVKELNLFVAVGGIYVAYSSDITNSSSWTTISILPSGSTSLTSIAYGNGMFVALDRTNSIYTSRDLITWTKTNFSNKSWYTVTYGYGRFVTMAIGAGTAPHRYVAYSFNGTNWVLATNSLVDNYWNSITYGRGTFMGVGSLAGGINAGENNGNLSISSIDGITWYRESTGRTPSGTDYDWNNVVFGQGMFVAVATIGVKTIMTYSKPVATGSLSIPNYTVRYSDPSFSILPNIVTNNNNDYIINYSSDNTTVANIIDGNLIIGNVGIANISLTIPSTVDYTSVTANTTITVNKKQSNIVVNGNFQQTYTNTSSFFYLNSTTNNNETPIIYSSNNPNIANVVADFVTVNGNIGNARITLYQPDTTNYLSVTASTIIYINPATPTLNIPNYTRKYKDLSFSILSDINTTNNDIPRPTYKYTSDYPLIANIVAGNMFIGNAGTANISIIQSNTLNYNSVTANIFITVNKIQANLEFPFASYTKKYKDLSFNLNANTTNTDSTAISYSTDNPIVANVNTTRGNITIGNAGTAIITLTGTSTTNYLSTTANIEITVNKLQTSLGYPNSSYTKNYKDLSFNLNANTTNTDSTQISYSTDNSIVANVNATGNVTIGNAGTAIITLTGSETMNYNSVTANISITVNPIQPILNYLANSSLSKKYLDTSFNLNANTTNTDSTEILYSTNNASVANVDINGNVTIGNAGTANITLTGDATTNYNSVNANISIIVNKIQPTIGYPNSSYTKNYLDASFQLNANTTNTDSTQILYTTNNASIANVDINGNVTIGNAGTANITLTGDATTNYNSVSANIAITVNKIQPTLGYPNSSYTKNYLDASFNLNANTTNTDSTQILYITNNASIANVDINGNVIIGNAGTANITLTGSATTNYLSTVANIAITVNKIQATLGYPNSSYTKNYKDLSFNLNANTTNTDSTQILYTTNNASVANVDINGNVVIGNAGTANITLTGSATTNYLSTVANISITVNKIQATLGYPNSSYTKIYKDLSFNLNANTTNTDSTQILYSTDNNQVAIVNTTGNVTIGNAGTANITLTGNATTNYLSTTANILITVNKIQPTLGYPNSSYTKNYKDLSFNLNANTTNTDSPQILYSTDNTQVAIVNTTGNVTIGNAGTANITLTRNATTNYNSVTANISITVNKIQPTLGYPNSSYTKNYKDLSFNLNANTTNTDSTQILYSTDNTQVAIVNTTGNVTIGNAGTANITLTGDATTNYNSVNANITIIVNKIQPTIGYPNSSYTKNYLDASFQLNANTTNTDSTQILYTTNNTSVANVDINGNVTIGNVGTANITLTGSATTNYNPVSANIAITVNKIQPTIGYPNSSYTKNYKDLSFNLNANTTNTDSTQILYTTNNASVANVDINGNVVIGNAGTANITLTGSATTNYNPVSANISITVNKIQASIGYPNSSYTKNYKDLSFNLNANTTNTDSTQILYSTDNNQVAIVNTTGNVTIGNAGTANITLTGSETTNYNSVTANISITVNKIQPTLGYPNSSYTKNYKDLSFNLNANTTNTDSTQILYSIDNTSVATVNTTGNVTIGNAGTANITLTGSATTNYNSVTANITITVNKIQPTLGYPNSSYTKNYKDLSFNLNANTTNTDSTQILYSTDNTQVAIVNTAGNVTIGNAGTANITLTGSETTNYNSVTSNISIIVNKIQATLGYPNSNYTKNYLDASFQLNANTTNTDSTQILYTTNNASVAIVDTTGNVTIGNAGTANITLTGDATTNYNSVNANISIIVNKLQPTLGYPNSSYTKNYLDASFQLNANTTNTDSSQILYTTNNASIANVDINGNVTIGNAGTANITLTGSATANYNSVTANILITVNKIQATLNYPAYSTITKNYRDLSFNLNANTSNKDSSTILYTVDNTNVATVDINGNVIMGNMGTANITLTGNATANYNKVTANIQLVINSLQTALNYPYSSYTKNYLDPSFSLNATTTNTDSPLILYSTDNTNVATVNATGNVIVGNAGTANITLTGNATANYNSVTANISITVNPIQATLGYPYSNYTKNYKDLSFNLNANTTNTDSTQILYSTDNNEVASVNATGNVTIGNAGTANIQISGNATTNYYPTNANILITVNKIQATLGYPYSNYTKNYKDLSFQLNANTTNTDSTQILYSTDNNQVAIVNTTGNVTIGNAGTANITLTGDATTNYYPTNANILITVNKIQATLEYPISSYTKNYLDPSFNLNANTTNTDSTQILYSTDNNQVAIVNPTGNVTIGNAGTANIQISGNATTNYNSVTANIAITVNKIQATLEYPISSYTKNYKDPSFNLNANTTNTDSTQILYSTDNNQVAIVNPTGNVTIGNAGTANITLTGNASTNYNSVTANIAITVNKIPATLGYPNSSYTKNYKDLSFNLNANTTNTDSTQILYSTDNTQVAIVNPTGNVTIGNAGTANITLTGNASTNYNSVTANIAITVNKIQPTLGYPNSSYTKNYKDLSFNLNANTTNTDSTQILYSTDNTSVAIVNTTGNVTIGNAGTANITLTGNATANYDSVTANILIVVNPIQPTLGYPNSSYTKNYLDASFQLNANTTNTDSTQILYSTDNNEVATVNTTGNVTIGNAGTANITLTGDATTNYNSVTANIFITVNPIEATIGYPNSSYTKNYLDASFPLNANTTNTDSPQILYSTDNTQVAIVDTDGNITIGNVGTANITLIGNATPNYYPTNANILITVNPLPSNITVPASFSRIYGNNTPFNLNASTNNPETPIEYTSLNTNVATVDFYSGDVTIGNVGNAQIQLYQSDTTNYTSSTADTTIYVYQKPPTLTIDESFTTNYLSSSFSILPNITTNNSDPISSILYTYNSTNTDVANVVDGIVTIGNVGNTTVTITQLATANFSDISTNTIIYVSRIQPNIHYTASYTKNYRDESFLLDANTTNTDSTQILYSTDNQSVAIVNAIGNVTIGNAGTANITLTGNQTANYYPVTANILINVNPIQPTLGYPNSSYTKNYLDASFSLNANTTNTDSTQIVYSTDNTNVTTVDTDGIVVIGNAGTANITLTGDATTNYNSVSANIAITVNPIEATLGYPYSSYTKNYLDASFPLNANTTNTDSIQILYSTDNTQVATVDTDGNITIGNVGTANITLIGNATPNYYPTAANILITVNPLSTNIIVPASFSTIYGNTTIFNLTASTNNPETPIEYTSLNTNVATVDFYSGDVTIGNVGNAQIQLYQSDTTNYTSSTADTTIYVYQKRPTLTIDASFNRNYLSPSFSIIPNISTNNNDPISSIIYTYNSTNTDVADVVDGIVTIGNAGNTVVTITQLATDNFSDISINTIIYVSRIQPNIYYTESYTKNYNDPSFLLNANTTNTDSTQIVYSTDNSDVATVDIETGTVIIGNAGTANISLIGNQTTNYYPVSANILITVNKIPANLEYPYSSYTKTYKDPSFSLDANTTNTDSIEILYSTDNQSVAIVGATGNVTIGNVGTANITLSGNQTTNYNSVSASIQIDVTPLQANLEYPYSSYTKTYADPSFSLNVNTTNTDSTQILYSIDNTDVAIVDTDGNVTIGNVGTANITLTGNATLNYYPVNANILINVIPSQATLDYPFSSYTKYYNDPSFPLNANTSNTENTTIIYSTDNPDVAIVDATGSITIGNTGTANITLSGDATMNYTSVIANILINVNPLETNLIYPYSSYIKNYRDPSFLLNADTTNTDNSQIVYSTDNPFVAIVDTVGRVTVGNVGTANIVLTGNATMNYTYVTANILIQVNSLQPTIRYPFSSYTKKYLDPSFNLNANTTNTDSITILYSTDNPAVADVNTSGNVIIGNAGTANITLTGNATTNYKSVTANILVTVNRLQANILYPFSIYNKIYKEAPFNLNASTTNTEAPQIIYSTSNPIVANVDAIGDITIGNAGTANITLIQNRTSNYNEITANIIINVARIQSYILVAPTFFRNYLDNSFNITAYTSTNNSETTIQYSSNNSTVANVDSYGNVIIGNAGNATVTMIVGNTTNYSSGSVDTIIYVNKRFSNITVDPSFTRPYGTIIPFNVNANKTNPETQIQYTSLNTGVASVDSYGNIIVGNVGNAIIRLYQPETTNYLAVTSNTVVYVNRILPTLSIDSSFTRIYQSPSFNLIPYINTTNTDGNLVIQYSTSNPTVARVFGGIVTIGNVGTATITIKQLQSQNFLEVTTSTIIHVLKKQTNIIVLPSITTITETPPFALNATTNNSETPMIYESSNPVVADIINGTIIVQSIGTTTITITQENTANYLGAIATTVIYVKQRPPYKILAGSVSLSNQFAYGVRSGTYTIKDKTALPAKCTPIFSKMTGELKPCSKPSF